MLLTMYAYMEAVLYGASWRDRKATGLRLLAVALALSLLLTGLPLFTGSTSPTYLTHEVSFSFPMAELTGSEHRPFHVAGTEIGVPGGSSHELPMLSQEVALPIGAKTIAGLRISHSDPVPLGEFEIPSLSYANSHGSSSGEESSLAYAGPVHHRDGVPNVPLSVTPIAYHDDGSAYFHETVTVEILYEEGPVRTTSSSSELHHSGPELLSGNYDMLMITSTSLEEEFERLERWRSALGIDARVYTTSQVAALYPDRSLSEAVRAFAWSQHNASDIDYLLLGGDASVVPAHKITLTAGEYTEDIPSDLYYGAYGGGADWSNSFNPVADVLVGRIPVSDAEGAKNYVDKVIAYETHSAGDEYLDNVSFLGEYLDERVWGGDVKDTNEQFVPEDRELTKYYERDEGKMSFDQIKPLVEESHIINNLGHGDYDFLATLRSSNVKDIDNDAPYIWYSQGCHVGGFDRGSVSNAMLADEKNSVANIVNSRFGWYISSSDPDAYISGPSNIFDMAFMERVFDTEDSLGRVHQDAKETQIENLDDQYIRWVYATLNLLGDPALRIGGYDEMPSMDMVATNDAELELMVQENEEWSGSGTAADPYRISGVTFDERGGCSITLENTTNHVLIEGNEFLGFGGGISLAGVSNVTVKDNLFSGKESAICIGSSSAVALENNTFDDNQEAISAESSELRITNNTLVSGNVLGLVSTDSKLTVENNIFSRGPSYAIMMEGDDSAVRNNSFVENNGTTVWEQGEQAYNDGVNDWSGNWWSDLAGAAEYSLAGDGADASPLEDNINDPPEFTDEIPPSAYSTQLLDLSAEAASGVDLYRASVGGDTFSTLYEAEVKAGDLGLGFGENNVTVKAYSGQGNLGILNFSIDYLTDLQILNITHPSEFHLNSSTNTLNWSVDDPDEVVRYEYRIDRDAWSETEEQEVTLSLEDGEHILRVRAYNGDGNFSFARAEFFIDTVDPRMSIESPLHGKVLPTSEWQLTWSAYDVGQEPSGLDRFELDLDGVTSVLPADARNHSLELDEGERQIVLRAVDKAGNDAEDNVTVIVDSSGPQVSIDTPEGHPRVGASTALSWEVSDEGSGVDRVLMRINGGEPVDVTGETSRHLEDLEEGHHLVELVAYDAIGNRGSASIGIVIGESPTIFDVTSPKNGHAGRPAEISWDVWGEGDFTFGYVLDGTEVPVGGALNASLDLDEGEHDIIIWAHCSDSDANHTRHLNLTVIEDTPALAWTSPAEGHDDHLFDVPIKVQYRDPALMDRLTSSAKLLEDDGYQIPGAIKWTANGTLVFEPHERLDNPQGFTLRVESTDLAANVRTDNISFSTRALSEPGRPVAVEASPEASWTGVYNHLGWEEPYDDGGYPTDLHPLVYTVYRHDGDGNWSRIGSTGSLSFVDRNGIVSGETYHYYVTASNIVGESGPSISAQADAAEELEDLDRMLSFVGFLMTAHPLQLQMFMQFSIEGVESFLSWFEASGLPLLEEAWAVLEASARDLHSLLEEASETIVAIAAEHGVDISWLNAYLLGLMILLTSLLFLFMTARRLGRRRNLEPEPVRRTAERTGPAVQRRRGKPSASESHSEAYRQAQEVLRDELEELDRLLEDGEIDEKEHRERTKDIVKRLSAVHLSEFLYGREE